MGMKKKVILLGLCFALVLSLGLPQQVNAREGDMENLKKMVDEFNDQLGIEITYPRWEDPRQPEYDSSPDAIWAWYEGIWVKKGTVTVVIEIYDNAKNETEQKAHLLYWGGDSSTPISFYGGQAIIETESGTVQPLLLSTGEYYGYLYEWERTRMHWYAGRFYCSLSFHSRARGAGTGIFGTTEALVTDELAELMYELGVQYGFIEPSTTILIVYPSYHLDKGEIELTTDPKYAGTTVTFSIEEGYPSAAKLEGSTTGIKTATIDDKGKANATLVYTFTSIEQLKIHPL